MENKKSLTIGITINLDNYENLRLELNGNISNDDDAAILISDLDRILSGLGQGDKVTAERIDSYRRRVLSQTGNLEKKIEVTEEQFHAEEGKEIGKTENSSEHAPDKKTTAGSEKGIETGSLFSYQEKEITEPAPVKEQTHDRPKEGEKGDFSEKPKLICESCGIPITEKQRKISQMFTDKNLCEKCIQAEQGMK